MRNRSRAVSSLKTTRTTRTLSREEVISLINGTYSNSGESFRDLRELIGLISNSGMRPGELARLKWSDVDFVGGFITVKHTKTGVLRNIPLGSSFAFIVRKRHARLHGTEFVLGTEPETLLRRTTKQLRVLSERVLGRPVQLRDFLFRFYWRWIQEGSNSPTLACVTLELITGRRGKRCLRSQLSPEQCLKLAAEIMQRIQQ